MILLWRQNHKIRRPGCRRTSRRMISSRILSPPVGVKEERKSLEEATVAAVMTAIISSAEEEVTDAVEEAM